MFLNFLLFLYAFATILRKVLYKYMNIYIMVSFNNVNMVVNEYNRK